MTAALPDDVLNDDYLRPRQGTLSDDDIEHHIKSWAAWHRRSRYSAFRRLWYPGKSIGFSTDRGVRNSDDMDVRVNSFVCKTMDALISDLPVTQRVAIHHVHGIATAVFRFPRTTVEQEYARALIALRPGMSRKGIVI